jgi:hypothetical protein
MGRKFLQFIDAKLNSSLSENNKDGRDGLNEIPDKSIRIQRL